MRSFLITLAALACLGLPARAQVSVSIGIDVPVYPELVLVPDTPVYYAPTGPANYFFYDRYYWVYRHDRWYRSRWYNGPWVIRRPDAVPVFLLRVPVRYYRAPPRWFHRGWRHDEPPRWGARFGPRWSERRRGWERWDHRPVHAAPPPAWQRHYSGHRYPRTIAGQHAIHEARFRHGAHDNGRRGHEGRGHGHHGRGKGHDRER
jgi:hypothetical protein